MKKVLVLLTILLSTTLAFSQIWLDGDISDWDAVTGGVSEWVDGVEGLYPEEVGAIVTDNVDIKNVKATIEGNTIFWMIQFWAGPVWPNMAYQEEYNGVPVNRSRGYYHVLLDLDNDVTTGWSSDWYEAHYTTVGYLASVGQTDIAQPIGAEILLGFGVNGKWTAPHPDSGGIKNSGIGSIGYETVDVSEYDGVSDNELMFGIAEYAGISDPDSNKAFHWQGALAVDGSHNESINADSRYFFHGHAWGEDFLETAFELTTAQQYFADKGKSFFNEGDVIGICGFSETPADDWGVDISTRGEFVCPAIPVRPNSITFDGDASDWADVPFAVEGWVDGVEGLYPEEVGAIVTDNVDIKDVKAFVNLEEDAMYWMISFWGGPAWPNQADQGEYNGVPVERSRGYYHVLLDLDNDPTTGWSTDWYEAHYTTVGYLASVGQTDIAKPLGAEVWAEWGSKYYKTPPHPDSGGIKNDGVQEVKMWLDDWSEYDGIADNELTFGIAEYVVTDPDSGHGMAYDAMSPNLDGADESLLTGTPEFVAHAWGFDFMEVGHSIAPIVKYFNNKKGTNFFNAGDVIGICGFSETPADDWGVDISTRGQFVVGGGTAVASRAALVDQFELGDNYPNPFNPTTSIDYVVPMTSDVSIIVYNTLGQAVRTLVDRTMQAGSHQVIWDGKNDAGQALSSGIYYYSLKAESFNVTKKMLLIK